MRVIGFEFKLKFIYALKTISSWRFKTQKVFEVPHPTQKSVNVVGNPMLLTHAINTNHLKEYWVLNCNEKTNWNRINRVNVFICNSCSINLNSCLERHLRRFAVDCFAVTKRAKIELKICPKLTRTHRIDIGK